MSVKHPAKFSKRVLAALDQEITREHKPSRKTFRILDPFAGVGLIHSLAYKGVQTTGVEIEPEWANQNPNTIVGDALDLPEKWTDRFDMVITSPAYGNRMADHHDAKDGSRRHTYRHVLGRPLSENSSGKMQWGDRYRAFHEVAYEEMERVTKPGGLIIVNISNHIRGDVEQRVTEWTLGCLMEQGLWLERFRRIKTPRNKHGANRDLRVPYEFLLIMRKGGVGYR